MANFESFIDLSNINTSMELDSTQSVAELTDKNFMLEIRVCGEVKVYFDDDIFKCASQMPDELLQLFHEGKAYEDERVGVVDNNWFEAFLYEKDGDGWVWTGSSDVVDCEGMTNDRLKEMMQEIIAEWTSNY